jgi:hypothetical protein
VGSDRISEVDVVCHVASGEHDGGGVAGVGTCDGEGTVVVVFGDAPPVAVLHPRPSAGGQAPVVLPGDDDVSCPGAGAVSQTDAVG